MKRVFAALIICIMTLLGGGKSFALYNGRLSEDPNGVRASTVAIETPEGLCTGTVIGRELVLTAAHCVAQKGRYRVYFLDEKFKSQPIAVQRAAHHPGFDAGDGFSIDDIGLLRVSPFPKFIKSAKLPYWFNFSTDGDEVTLAGYGATEKRNLRDGILREADMKAVPPSVKKSNFAGLESQTEKRVGMCVGDSGGPVFRHLTQTVIGVLKGGTTEPDKTCTSNPIFTPVRPYTGWIKIVAEKWGVTIGE
jgi:secreted trypsin-like serine protease